MNRTRPRHETKCAEIVETARDLLVSGGLDAFAMRAVATAADMRLGNLQYYFATRDELLEAVIRQEFTTDLAMVEASANAGDGIVDMGELAHRMVENWSSDSGEVFVTLSLLAYHNDRFRALNREIYESFYAAISVVIRQLDRRAKPAEVRTRALLMTSVLDGVALQVHAAVRNKPESNELIERATGLLVAIAAGE